MEFKRKIENYASITGLVLILYGSHVGYNFHSVATSRDAITSLRAELSRVQENLGSVISDEDRMIATQRIEKEIANNKQAIRLSMKRVNPFYDL